MHKYGGLPLRQNDVGAAGQSTAPECKPEAHAVKQRSNVSFRAGIGTPDPAHVPTASLRCQRVHIRQMLALCSRSPGLGLPLDLFPKCPDLGWRNIASHTEALHRRLICSNRAKDLNLTISYPAATSQETIPCLRSRNRCKHKGKGAFSSLMRPFSLPESAFRPSRLNCCSLDK